ncbi:MAG: hypothetical protein OXI96_02985 [Acidimicrobiaceae bacterium]|nr:hypothetical protein [Acidimicrobiaceae bacterium]
MSESVCSPRRVGLRSPLVIAETAYAYLIGRQLGLAAEARFFHSIANGEIRIEPLTGTDC